MACQAIHEKDKIASVEETVPSASSLLPLFEEKGRLIGKQYKDPLRDCESSLINEKISKYALSCAIGTINVAKVFIGTEEGSVIAYYARLNTMWTTDIKVS